jgi:3-isopropylmalate/(R)-2-methylmalate dehydratase small subunit
MHAGGFGWVVQGRCWRLGDHVGVDGDLIDHEFAVRREMDPEVLRQHLLLNVDPAFAAKVSPGDIIVAGRRFAHGNPHIQGLLALRGAGLSVLAESMPGSSVRNAVNAGLKVLPRCPDVTQMAEQGDELRVDFATGAFFNLSRGHEAHFTPLGNVPRRIIALGGWRSAFSDRLNASRAGSR